MPVKRAKVEEPADALRVLADPAEALTLEAAGAWSFLAINSGIADFPLHAAKPAVRVKRDKDSTRNAWRRREGYIFGYFLGLKGTVHRV